MAKINAIWASDMHTPLKYHKKALICNAASTRNEPQLSSLESTMAYCILLLMGQY